MTEPPLTSSATLVTREVAIAMSFAYEEWDGTPMNKTGSPSQVRYLLRNHRGQVMTVPDQSGEGGVFRFYPQVRSKDSALLNDPDLSALGKAATPSARQELIRRINARTQRRQQTLEERKADVDVAAQNGDPQFQAALKAAREEDRARRAAPRRAERAMLLSRGLIRWKDADGQVHEPWALGAVVHFLARPRLRNKRKLVAHGCRASIAEWVARSGSDDPLERGDRRYGPLSL